MKRLTLKCQVITPLFMAGADGNTPELRPSEFKAMMRFWWRAIMAEDNIERLKEDEAKIFGGTGEKQGRSRVNLKILNNVSKFKSNLKDDYQLQWNFDRINKRLSGKHYGIAYILYSTILKDKTRKYFYNENPFQLEISSFDENSFKKAIAALWLAIHLGGFGTRARRGGGNLTVKEINGESNNLDFIPKGNSSQDVANWIMKNFENAKNMIIGKIESKFATKYSNLSLCRFIISNMHFKEWTDALNAIGKIYSDFRTKNKNKIFETAIFGLPVMHRNGIVEGRRASPIIFKIIKSEGSFYWMVIRLSGEFLPEKKELKFKGKTQKPDYKLIDEFWNELKKDGKEWILNQPDNLEKIKKKLEELNPQRIILYGSRARGDAHKNSDIDLAVETDKSIEMLGIEGPFDIVNLKKADASLRQRIEKEGIILYERKG